ncbi:MAG: hypothetical protein D6775_05405 [Caldilineae bacterium]|nr:MAG: hypothetical protein D6775_05405 [Caldilineae bacterium]
MTHIFLNAHSNGITRAERTSSGEWRVTHHAIGHRVACLAADPFHPARVYAGTSKGILRSDDHGLTWRLLGMERHIVKSLAVSPHDPGVLYAGTKPPAVFKSEDGGAHWMELEAFQRIRGRRFWRSPAEPPDWRAYVMAIALSPTDPKVVVAGIEFGAVVRSEDGGRTWSNHRKGAIRDCHSLTFHAKNGDWVYEAGGRGAAVSQDGGRTWEQPREGLDRRYGWACAADPERPEIWYISAGPIGWKGVPQAHVDGAANSYIFRKAGGAAWEKLGGGLPQPMPYLAYALLTDPGSPGHVYAGLANGQVWHSTDYGDSWQCLPFNLGRIWRMTLMKSPRR